GPGRRPGAVSAPGRNLPRRRAGGRGRPEGGRGGGRRDGLGGRARAGTAPARAQGVTKKNASARMKYTASTGGVLHPGAGVLLRDALSAGRGRAGPRPAAQPVAPAPAPSPFRPAPTAGPPAREVAPRRRDRPRAPTRP